MRSFVGIALTEALARRLSAAGHELVAADPRWRDEKWVQTSNLHMTLHFLGEIEEAVMRSLATALREAVAPHHAFDLPLMTVRAVPSERKSRMLWTTFADSDGRCAALAESVQRAASEFGIERDERPFVPHVTLCRARRPLPVDGAALQAATAELAATLETMSVGTVTLFVSRLTPHGSVYSAIEEFPLRGE